MWLDEIGVAAADRQDDPILPDRPADRQSAPPIRRNGLVFDIPRQGEPLPEAKPAKATPPKKIQRTCDPRLVRAARELRDRWLEQVNATALVGVSRYDVTRCVEKCPPLKALAA